MAAISHDFFAIIEMFVHKGSIHGKLFAELRYMFCLERTASILSFFAPFHSHWQNRKPLTCQDTESNKVPWKNVVQSLSTTKHFIDNCNCFRRVAWWHLQGHWYSVYNVSQAFGRHIFTLWQRLLVIVANSEKLVALPAQHTLAQNYSIFTHTPFKGVSKLELKCAVRMKIEFGEIMSCSHSHDHNS